jgi:hypothetical protein
MITSIGDIVQKTGAANTLVENILAEFDQLQNDNTSLKAAYLIWRDPYMTVGHDTFIHDMLTRCGLKNIFADRTRYPTVTIEDLKHCEVLLLSSEPFPFSQKHIDELQPLLPNAKIILADGEMFSWYGSRLLQAPSYFRALSDKLKVKSQN